MDKDHDDASIGPLRSLLKRLVDPSQDWAQRGEERRPSALMIYTGVLLGVLALVAVLTTRMAQNADAVNGLLVAVWVSLGVAAAIIVLLAYQIRRHFFDPLAHLYNWALGMCDGDLSSRIPPEQTGRFAKLAFHINRLSEALEKLLAGEDLDALLPSEDGVDLARKALFFSGCGRSLWARKLRS